MNKTVILQPNSRITRSKAAWISSEAPNQQNQKRVLRSNSKRLASDNDSSILNLKKRAVLEDVTNVCCRTSYRNSLNATKIPKKNKKTTKSDKLNSTKVETSKALGIEEVAVDSTQGEAKIELQLGDAVCSINSNANLGFHLSKESVVRGSGKHDSHFGTPSLYFSNNGIIDIDSDLKDPQLCSLYAPEIYCNLRVAENSWGFVCNSLEIIPLYSSRFGEEFYKILDENALLKRPNSDSMETVQRDITRGMRGILIDWLVEVSEEYKLVPDTLYLTVYIIDVYLSENYIERQKLQLLGITSMLIASKYEEICAPRVEEFCFITDNTYTKEEVLKMETQVLNYLRFQLSSPTAKTFLRRFLRAAQASCKPLNVKLEFLANYLTELTLLDYDFLKILPSRVAASAVFLARWTLDQSLHPWDQTLQHYTNYKALDLKTTVFALRCLQLNTSGCPLNAVRAKYKQDKFKSVASLSSPELVETMFGS